MKVQYYSGYKLLFQTVIFIKEIFSNISLTNQEKKLNSTYINRFSIDDGSPPL